MCCKRAESQGSRGQRQRDRRSLLSDRGFTLVELMVVIVIIGLLAGAVTASVRSYLIRGKQSVAAMEIAKICQALDTFYTVTDQYPSSDLGIALLSEKTDTFPDGLLSKMPSDPWKRPYIYQIPGQDSAYEVTCYGADGQQGGEGANKDISSVGLE